MGKADEVTDEVFVGRGGMTTLPCDRASERAAPGTKESTVTEFKQSWRCDATE